MLVTDFDYELPKELIAQHPMEPRDHSRLLVVNNCLLYTYDAADELLCVATGGRRSMKKLIRLLCRNSFSHTYLTMSSKR